MKAFIEFGGHCQPNLMNLLDSGWHGIIVEPHPLSVVKLYETLVSAGDFSFDLYSGIVGPDEGKIVTYKSGSETFSQLGVAAAVGGTPSSTYADPCWADHKGPGLKLVSITLDRLVRESPYPVERFEVDCEGMEIDIFESYSWIKKPADIKVELHTNELKDRLLSTILKEGYEIVDVDDYYNWHFRKI